MDYRTSQISNNTLFIFFSQKAKEMVHAMNTRTPSTDSKMGLSSSNAGFVAKALGQSIKNKALFTETTSVSNWFIYQCYKQSLLYCRTAYLIII